MNASHSAPRAKGLVVVLSDFLLILLKDADMFLACCQCLWPTQDRAVLCVSAEIASLHRSSGGHLLGLGILKNFGGCEDVSLGH